MLTNAHPKIIFCFQFNSPGERSRKKERVKKRQMNGRVVGGLTDKIGGR